MPGTDATFPLCVATSSKLPADPSPKRSKNRGHWPSTVLPTSCPRVLPLLSSIPTFPLMPRQVLSLNSGARVPPTCHRFSSRLYSHRYQSPSPKSAIFRTARIAADIKSVAASPKATSAPPISESNPLHSPFSKLFVAPKNINPFGIKQIRTLSPEHPGVGCPSLATQFDSRPVCSPFVFMVLQIAFPGTRLF